MHSHSTNGSVRHLLPRQTLSDKDANSIWRIQSGALRIDHIDDTDDDKVSFVRLALPGDLLGVEYFSGVRETLRVQAITAVSLVLVSSDINKCNKQLLMTAVAKNHVRCRQVVSLKTGPVDERVKRLLHMLMHDEDNTVEDGIVCRLPSLGNIADIVNSTRETVSRILTCFREANILIDSAAKPMNRKHMENRLHRLKPDATCYQ